MRDADGHATMTDAELDLAGFYYRDATTPALDAFSGIAFSNTAVVVGADGYLAYRAAGGDPLDLTDGRFSACIRHGAHECLAFADPFGLDSIFYYWADGWWALSNSFKLLIDRLSAAGRRLTLHRAGLAAFLFDHSFGQTLVSSRTAVAEVRVLPPGSALVLNATSLSLVPLATLQPTLPQQDYPSLIRSFVRRGRDRIRALQAVFPHITVDLSGGIDSRLTFGLAHTAGLPPGVLEVQSNPAKPNDYTVASQICRAYGYTPAPPRPRTPSLDPDTCLDLIDFGNLGVYSPVYLPTGTRPQPRLHIHGGAGEFYRRYYSAPSLDVLLARLRLKITDTATFQEIRADLHAECTAWAVDPASPEALLHHYRNHRGRHHFGRNAFRSLSGIVLSPLACRELLEASRLLPVENLLAGDMIRDLFAAIHPDLLSFPFDKPEKSYLREGLSSSPLLSSPSGSDAPTDLQVFVAEVSANGEPSNTPTSPVSEVYIHAVYRALGRCKGATGPFDIVDHDHAAACIASFKQHNLFPSVATRCHIIRLAAYLLDRGVSPP